MNNTVTREASEFTPYQTAEDLTTECILPLLSPLAAHRTPSVCHSYREKGNQRVKIPQSKFSFLLVTFTPGH